MTLAEFQELRISSGIAAPLMGLSNQTFARLINADAFPRAGAKEGHRLGDVIAGTVKFYVTLASGRSPGLEDKLIAARSKEGVVLLSAKVSRALKSGPCCMSR